ncbi:spinster family MFS transporter [Novosphingobium profundi]|uniref:spinster family MFS transporter n=1 Tax=Novosphingobium profundi TaxID=1774954 RepID=UPI001CFC81AF|nr:MFS transporter [Novosphingobium profundi]
MNASPPVGPPAGPAKPAVAAPPVENRDGPGGGVPYLLVGMMFLTYAFSYLDRQIVNIVAEHMKADLDLADWQIGAMSGLGFALLYTTLGLPVARLAERTDRVNIISAALVLWSGCTALFGLGRNFFEVFLARIGVGLGEAGGSPPAMSMIADATPRAYQSRALALYNLGVPMGALLGMVLGGFVVDALGWRWAFWIVGPPGILLAILIRMLLRDPRGAAGKAAAKPGDVPSLREVAANLRRNTAFWWIAAGAALTTFVGYGQQTFYASFFLRNHADQLDALAVSWGLAGPTTVLGVGLGIAFGLGGTIGTILGGQLGDRWRSPHAYLWVPALGSALAVPLYIATLLLPSAGFSLALLVVPVALKSMWYGPTYAAIQRMTHARSRATVLAIFLFLLNALGLGFGPLSIGLISDWLAQSMGEAQGLRWSLIAVTAVSVLSSLCFVAAKGRRGEVPN